MRSGEIGLLALLAVTLASVIGAIAVSGASGPTAEPVTGGKVLPLLEPNLSHLARLTFTHNGKTITLERAAGEEWVMLEKDRYPVDPKVLHRAVLGLAEARLVEPKTRVAALYPRLEVEDGGNSTTLQAQDDQGKDLGQVLIGKRRIDELGGGNDGLYVRKAGDAQSWLARATLELPEQEVGWLDRRIVDLGPAMIKEMTLTQPDGATLRIGHEKPQDPFTLLAAPADTKPKEEALLSLSQALAQLQFNDVHRAGSSEETGSFHAEIIGFDGMDLKITLAERDKVSWAHFTAGANDAAQALNAKLAPWDYALSPEAAAALKTKLADLLDGKNRS
ncbi:MAG TPA: DUF4340 domain-containing protein [Stellaceae bacterium]|nr:DUF4340 domain-containing protein [Stellaceae bacterium]